ncbi:Periplasmic binding protein [Streptomyces sp. YIM 130001]|uniref:ABC transporter substrate-binding protein n=1 Tax=Streptomyces sp. YIM 130001 TaxID=2259644 RepID=UPI000E65C6A7|nr:ABC transporter substrate-binding protein [Streptomyces sp. YIM 130001]RII14285.1 Periplasmic binding protein [Streptomyces sp. YIM 130001]
MQESEWQFQDDRGQLSRSAHRPARVIAYIQAGATLWDHGIRPVGIYGSHHDGAAPDRAKSGSLPLDEIDYLGAGSAIDLDRILAAQPDLVVAVTYGGGQVYGIDPDTAKHLEEQVPVVVIDVGQAHDLDAVRARFADLARVLGAEETEASLEPLRRARQRLRDATAAVRPGPRVLALSPAGDDQAHLARPGAWPELRALTACGVTLAAPPEGPGANWATLGLDAAVELRPDVLLVDVRANATPLSALRDSAVWQELEARARVVPWNPEAPCSPAGHARLFELAAEAVTAAGPGEG